jgi:hypothetical protein
MFDSFFRSEGEDHYCNTFATDFDIARGRLHALRDPPDHRGRQGIS